VQTGCRDVRAVCGVLLLCEILVREKEIEAKKQKMQKCIVWTFIFARGTNMVKNVNKMAKMHLLGFAT
jgi:hypothetical protein